MAEGSGIGEPLEAGGGQTKSAKGEWRSGSLPPGKVVGFIVLLFLLFVFGKTFFPLYTVDEGERAVVLRNGAVIDVKSPGLHARIPILDDIVPMSVRTHKTLYSPVMAYSKDIQAATTTWSVNFHVDPTRVRDVYSSLGRSVDEAVNTVLAPKFPDRAKAVFGQYTAVNVVTQRNALVVAVLDSIQEAVGPNGIVIESVQLENVDFSDEYERSIEERMKAEVEVAKLSQNWEREKVQADIVRTKAQAEADATLMRAGAQASSIRLRGEAEASAIKARSEALRDNPDLVALTAAEKWNGTLPQTMIPGGALPFVPINPPPSR